MKKKNLIGWYIIGSALIWGLVIVGCSLALKGTECYSEIQNILVGGVVTHLILIWGPLAIQLKKQKQSEN